MQATRTAAPRVPRRSPRWADVDRAAMLPAARLAELSRVDGRKSIGLIVLDYAIMIAAAALCEAFWSPLAYIVAVMLIGARQNGLFNTGAHEGTHRLISRNLRLNDFVGEAVLASVLAMPFKGLNLSIWSQFHLDHHRLVSTWADPERDVPREAFFRMSPARKLLHLLAALSGVMYVTLVLLGLFGAGSARQKAWTVVTLSALAAGFAVFPDAAMLWVMYWLVPLATWNMFANEVRSLGEHLPLTPDHLDGKVTQGCFGRDIVPNAFDLLFITPRYINYHLTHHLFPAVPYYRLPQLHREIAPTEAYRRVGHVTHGYHRVLRDAFRIRASDFALDSEHGEVPA